VNESAFTAKLILKQLKYNNERTLLRRKLFLYGFILSVLLCSPLAVSVEADTMWSRTYGGTSGDAASSLVATSDGGYAIAGNTRSFGTGEDDFWLVKTNALGNIEWNKTYSGGSAYYEACSLVATSDGGYAIAGDTDSFGYLGDLLLVKTDASGNMEWSRTYGGDSYDKSCSLVVASDGGYAIAGSTWFIDYSDGGQWDFWLIKTDALGNVQWSKTYGGAKSDEARSLVATSDGGYAIAGETSSFGAGLTDAWLVRTDASGNMAWNKTYGGTGIEMPFSLVTTPDGGYAITGHTDWEAFWLVKTDAFGNEEWNRTLATVEDCSLIATSDGGFAIAGTVNGDFWLCKIDAFGNMQWNQTYGGTGYELANSLAEASDGGFAIAGIWNFTSPVSFESQDYNGDFWVLKTDAFGVVPEYSSWLVPALVLTATAFLIIKAKRKRRRA
jgi:hypothetical protein